MYKHSFLFIAGLALGATAIAQHKNFTIAEATNGMATTLAPASIKQATWEPGTDKLYQVIKTGAGDAWIATTFPKGNIDTVLRLSELNKAVSPKQKLNAMPTLGWLDKGLAYFNTGKDNDLKQGVMTVDGFRWSDWVKLPENAANLTIHKSGNIAYTIDNNLWLYTKERKFVRITNDVDKNIINGQEVHRKEFGIDSGIFFSPQGNYLAYYHLDQTMVNDYPIIDWSTVPAKVNNIKYPMAGGTSHQASVYVYNPTTGTTIRLETEGPKDQYLTCVTWSPDEKYIYIAILNREQNYMWLNQYDVHTGKKIKTLFNESNDKYVEPQYPLTFIPGSNDKFIWESQRDGFMHLYLYNTNGKLIKQLTKGPWLVNEIIGSSIPENELIITASKESPLEKHAYTVNWNTGSMKRLDNAPGTHTITASESGKYITDVYSNATTAKATVVKATHGNYSKDLLVSANTLVDYSRPQVQNITLKASDGTPLYGKLILPVNFNSNKKYPVIVYLYNGPHVQLVKNTFPESGNLWYEYMAQKGYVVFSMDGRGSGNRGLAFEQATFRQLGVAEVEDQLKGVEYLKSLPFVDASRMGVHGWSFGGFMTTSLMLQHPGVFKCAVAGGPVMDWAMYEVMYTERYMDTPEENPEGYAHANLLNQVKNLQGKLMLIHGTDDNTVVWQHSINFLKKCVDEGVQVDYYVYPGHEHNVRGKDRAHLMQKVSDYFDLYLKP